MVLKFNIDKNLGDTKQFGYFKPNNECNKYMEITQPLPKSKKFEFPLVLSQKKKTVDDIRKLKTKLKSCFYFCS